MANNLNKIAYIDDDELIYNVVKFSLEKLCGFELEVYTSGLEALQSLPDAIPDLILLDFMMPEMDGVTVLKELKNNEQLKNIPVFFITAKEEGEVLEAKLKNLGAEGIIYKPFKPKELGDLVQKMWSDL